MHVPKPRNWLRRSELKTGKPTAAARIEAAEYEYLNILRKSSFHRRRCLLLALGFVGDGVVVGGAAVVTATIIAAT